MKKEYAKPYLAIESFQLDASIAGGSCQINLNALMDTCSFVQAAEVQTNLDIYYGPACSRDGGIDMLQHMQPNADICYHGPMSTLATIGS